MSDYSEYMEYVFRGRSDPAWFIEKEFGVQLYPKQKEILEAFYTNNYKYLFLVAGMRSGKSVLATAMGAYEFFLLSTLPNPAEYYGLVKGQMIHISIVSTSETQARDSIFDNMTNMLKQSTFFTKYTNVGIFKNEVINYDKNVVIRVLSSWASTAVGRSNKAVIFDELSNFEDNDGKRGAWDIYTRLSKSTDTFHGDGHIVAISSPRHPNDILMTNYRRGLKKKNTLALKYPTWEMNPHLTEQELRNEHAHNIEEFYRDYACKPGSSGGLEFPNGIYLDREMTNLLKMDLEGFNDQYNMRICAIDPAVKNDSFGVAVGYHDGDKIVIDGVTSFRRQDGEPYIKPSDVRAFFDRIIVPLNINTIIFDAWMYTDILEHLKNKYGIEHIKHIVSKEDYDRWKSMQESGGVKVVYEEQLEKETTELVIKSEKKVDHPHSGSKDVADCVANIIWHFSDEEFLKEKNKPRFVSFNTF